MSQRNPAFGAEIEHLLRLGDTADCLNASRLCVLAHVLIDRDQRCDHGKRFAADTAASTTRKSYLFSVPAPVGTGRSEFQISVPHFHLPLGCFSQTSQYLPRSFVPSFMVSS
jgi:hypothetical protein